MSKGIKFDRCRECEHYLDILETYDRKPRYWCSELKKYIVGDGSTIHPDCPLPDWPSVSKADVMRVIALDDREALWDYFRSIGVEIIEDAENKD